MVNMNKMIMIFQFFLGIYRVNLPYSPQLLVGKPATFKAVVSISDKFKNEKVAYVWKDNDITQDPKSPSMATLLPASKGSFNLTVELGPEKETTTIPFETIGNSCSMATLILCGVV